MKIQDSIKDLSSISSKKLVLETLQSTSDNSTKQRPPKLLILSKSLSYLVIDMMELMLLQSSFKSLKALTMVMRVPEWLCRFRNCLKML